MAATDEKRADPAEVGKLNEQAQSALEAERKRVRDAVDALEGAHEFLASVESWKGGHEDDLSEQLAATSDVIVALTADKPSQASVGSETSDANVRESGDAAGRTGYEPVIEAGIAGIRKAQDRPRLSHLKLTQGMCATLVRAVLDGVAAHDRDVLVDAAKGETVDVDRMSERAAMVDALTADAGSVGEGGGDGRPHRVHAQIGDAGFWADRDGLVTMAYVKGTVSDTVTMSLSEEDRHAVARMWSPSSGRDAMDRHLDDVILGRDVPEDATLRRLAAQTIHDAPKRLLQDVLDGDPEAEGRLAGTVLDAIRVDGEALDFARRALGELAVPVDREALIEKAVKALTQHGQTAPRAVGDVMHDYDWTPREAAEAVVDALSGVEGSGEGVRPDEESIKRAQALVDYIGDTFPTPSVDAVATVFDMLDTTGEEVAPVGTKAALEFATERCPDCDGDGYHQDDSHPGNTNHPCEKCGSTGRVPKASPSSGLPDEPTYRCSKCRAEKGEHALGEACNGNCGGTVIRVDAQSEGEGGAALSALHRDLREARAEIKRQNGWAHGFEKERDEALADAEQLREPLSTDLLRNPADDLVAIGAEHLWRQEDPNDHRMFAELLPEHRGQYGRHFRQSLVALADYIDSLPPSSLDEQGDDGLDVDELRVVVDFPTASEVAAGDKLWSHNTFRVVEKAVPLDSGTGRVNIEFEATDEGSIQGKCATVVEADQLVCRSVGRFRPSPAVGLKVGEAKAVLAALNHEQGEWDAAAFLRASEKLAAVSEVTANEGSDDA